MRHHEARVVVRPHPPSAIASHHKGTKRFSVRDGFHLRDRNDEKRVEIDHAMAAENGIVGPTSVGELVSNQTNETTRTRSDQPFHSDPVQHRASCVDTEVAMIFDFLQRPPPAFTIPDGAAPDPSALLHPPTATETPNNCATISTLAHRQADNAAILSRTGPSADWLIFRHRSNNTPRRKEQQLEQRIAEVLSAKEDQLLQPTAPTAKVNLSTRRAPRRHVPIATPAIKSTALTPRPAATRDSSPSSAFSTQRSRLREMSAVPLKTDKLLNRLHELRTFPAVVERVLELNQSKRQAMIHHHGENIITKNKMCHSLIPPLQRPVHTPVFPSLVERKQQQAAHRKQLVDATQERTLKKAVDRWQHRRLELQQLHQTQYVQSQWLLLTTLGNATAVWMKQFHDYRARRELIFRLAMINKIQRSWKQQQLLRKHRQAVLALPPNSPLRSKYFRLPSVLYALLLLQRRMRQWLAHKQYLRNQQAVELIVTSWLEFQDVKFRRIILRFRKRVREFQTRFRTWRSITDARLKLLLLVWAKLERQHKRRGGLVTTTETEPHRPSPSKKQSQPRTTSSEILHRHLRNGGMVETAVSALGSSMDPTKPSPRTSPLKIMLPELTLQQTVEEDLHFAMRDYYATSNLSPTSPRSPTKHHHSTSGLPPVASHHGSQSMGKKKTLSASLTPLWHPTVLNHSDEKIPHALKVSLLRQLLSAKRKTFQATKDRRRAEWKEKRQQLRETDFRYNVLDELAAYQRFEAAHSVFLVLQSISESEILQLFQLAHQRLRVASTIEMPMPAMPHAPVPVAAPARKSLTPMAPVTASSVSASASASSGATAPRRSRSDGPRRSTLLTIHPRTSIDFLEPTQAKSTLP